MKLIVSKHLHPKILDYYITTDFKKRKETKPCNIVGDVLFYLEIESVEIRMMCNYMQQLKVNSYEHLLRYFGMDISHPLLIQIYLCRK